LVLEVSVEFVLSTNCWILELKIFRFVLNDSMFELEKYSYTVIIMVLICENFFYEYTHIIWHSIKFRFSNAKLDVSKNGCKMLLIIFTHSLLCVSE